MKPGPIQIMLGLELNTRKMVVGMTQEYRENLHGIMRKHWHKGRKTFKIKEMLTLVGKLARLGKGAQWGTVQAQAFYQREVIKAGRHGGEYPRRAEQVDAHPA